MTETREHRRLVMALLRYLQGVGCVILAADAPGWPRTPTLGGRRPDVLAYYRIGGCMIVGEAKRGPEIWESVNQLTSVARGLPGRGPIGSAALVVLAVAAEWHSEGRAVCDAISQPRSFATAWTPPLAAL